MIIEHIDQVLPHIAGRNDFITAKKDGYTVIDYVYAAADTFDDFVRLECRGIKFAPDGRTLARPFQKFFNIGERPETQPDALDFSAPHVVMEKLDGSMIHPAVVGGKVVFMTRMGRTDVAVKAERHLSRELAHECETWLNKSVTPIFEFTAPDNRIVVPYATSALYLLALRNTVTGEYLEWSQVERAARAMLVYQAPIHDAPRTASEFLAHTRAVTGMEGFVVRFADGRMVKAKGEEYVLKHKAKDSILQEKNVLALVLRGEVDDVLPLLDGPDRLSVQQYRDDVLTGVSRTARMISDVVTRYSDLSQKEFALGPAATMPPLFRPLAFQIRGGGEPVAAVTALLLKHVGSASAVEGARGMFCARFALGTNDNAELRDAA
ncbi:RNA_lig_T4_1 domain-containing protein [Hyphomicrobiales bacterium]|nr:RNA_lig_T4_1 domain-containing protein [Hyphomicrobiales bacterium]CAH1669444.1 RNA_lig_T4_1 domain-containing protein [Hyphomicrobiales bacterium]